LEGKPLPIPDGTAEVEAREDGVVAGGEINGSDGMAGKTDVDARDAGERGATDVSNGDDMDTCIGVDRGEEADEEGDVGRLGLSCVVVKRFILLEYDTTATIT
jgi:hypothetical protein